PVTRDVLRALRRIDGQNIGRGQGTRGRAREALGSRFGDTRNLTSRYRTQDSCGISFLRTWKTSAAVQQGHPVVLGERDGVFNRGVAGPDDNDALASNCFGGLERVLNARQLSAGNTDLA